MGGTGLREQTGINIIPENLVSGFNFILTQVPAKVIVGQGYHLRVPLILPASAIPLPEKWKFYGVSLTTQLGLVASGITVVEKEHGDVDNYNESYAFIRFPKLGSDYYIGWEICFEPAGETYSGMVVDLEGGVEAELSPAIAGVYSQLVTARTALESPAPEDREVVDRIIEAFIENEVYSVIYSYVLDVSLVERHVDSLRTIHDYTPEGVSTVAKIIDGIMEDIADSPEINKSVARVKEFAESLTGYTGVYRDPATIMNAMVDEVLFNRVYLVVWNAVSASKANISTTPDFIKQQPDVWRLTFVK